MKKTLFLCVFLVLFSAILFLVFQGSPPRQTTLIFSGILHGSLLPHVAKSGDYKGEYLGGLSYLGGLLKQLREELGGNLLFLDCGDNCSGTPEAYYTQGEAVVSCLNRLSIDAMLIGNREFDFGPGVLKKNLESSNFTNIGTNMVDKNSSGLKFEFVKIVNRGGIRFGVIGLVPPETSSLTEKSNTAGFEFQKAAESVPGFVKSLRNSKVDLIIALTQLDYAVNLKEIRQLAGFGIDLIQALEYGIPNRIERAGNAFIVLHDGNSKGTNVQRVDIEYSEKQLKIREVKRIVLRKETIRPDLKLSQQINEYVRKIDGIMNQVFATIEEDYANEYYAESVIGNAVTDIMRSSSGADIAFQNSAGMRSDLKKGRFTVRMLHDLFPFDNEVILLSMKGEDIRELLELLSNPERGVLQTSGLHYEIDPEMPEGRKLVRAESGGKPLEDSRVYLVATNSYLAAGGERYKSFSRATKIKSFGSLRELVKKELTSTGIFKGQIENRIVIRKKQ